MSEPFIIEVIKGFPNSANSNVIQAAAKITNMKQLISGSYYLILIQNPIELVTQLNIGELKKFEYLGQM